MNDQFDHETRPVTVPDEGPTQPHEPVMTRPDMPSTAVAPSGVAHAMTPAVLYGQGRVVADGPIGKSRSFTKVLLLSIVTLGFYQLYWIYAVHDDMKRHSGEGLGGGLAVIVSFFFGIITAFMLPKEIGDLYAARGWKEPVSGSTGLWQWPGCFILLGPFVWLYKCTTAINDYWAAVAQERGIPVRV